MRVDEIFIYVVCIFAAAAASFFFWWAIDVRRTSVAVDAAHAQLAKIGILMSSPNREISERMRHFVTNGSAAHDHEIYLVVASLYLLRRQLGLSCMFFARELLALPNGTRRRLLDSRESHIQQSDIQRILPRVDAPALAMRVAERFENNIEDLKADLQNRNILIDDHVDHAALVD